MPEKEKPIDRLHGTLRSGPDFQAEELSADATTRGKALGERALARLGGTLAPRETEGTTVWAAYLDRVKDILGNSPTMRITEPFKGEPPRVLLNRPGGEVGAVSDIGPLLSPGFQIRRHRPDGDELFTITGGPSKPPIGSSQEYTLAIRRDRDGGNMNIPVTDLIAPHDESGRSWRLEVPESLPDSFEPAVLAAKVA